MRDLALFTLTRLIASPYGFALGLLLPPLTPADDIPMKGLCKSIEKSLIRTAWAFLAR